MKELKYFEYEEFDCPYARGKDTGFRFMDRHFLWMLDQAREYAGLKFTVVKGYISQRGAERINELQNSSHLIGRAAVIKCTNSYKRYRIVAALLEAGFSRIGIGLKHIYVDNDDMKADAIFDYIMHHNRRLGS
jgi:hypothetical protein